MDSASIAGLEWRNLGPANFDGRVIVNASSTRTNISTNWLVAPRQSPVTPPSRR